MSCTYKTSKNIRISKKLIYLPTNVYYQVLSAYVANKHGIKTHGVFFDELHTQPNRKQFEVMTKGSGDAHMKPLYFLITTAGTDTYFTNTLVKRYEKATSRVDELSAEWTRKHDRDCELQLFIEFIKKQPLVLESRNERLWVGLLKKATVFHDGRMVFKFINGAEIEV